MIYDLLVWARMCVELNIELGVVIGWTFAFLDS